MTFYQKSFVALGSTLLFSVVCPSAELAGTANRDISNRVREVLRRAAYLPGAVGVSVRCIDNDSIIVAVDADSPMIPASVQKLVTGAMALEYLGPDYLFVTRTYIAGRLDPDSGTLCGDLYIKGGADPGLFVERLWLLGQQLQHRGVRRITGDLVLDDSFLDSVTQGPGFGEDASSRAYDAPVGAVSASFNCVAVHVRPGSRKGSPVHVDLFPPLQGVKLVNVGKTTAGGKPGAIDAKTSQTAQGPVVEVSGALAVDDKPRYIYRKMWNATANFGDALQAMLTQNSVSIGGVVRRGRLPDSLAAREPFLAFESQPLSEFVRHMFKESSNFAAEMVLKTVAAERSGVPGSWATGVDLATQWWRSRGLPGTPAICNGSGMGKGNRISATQITALLSYVWKQKAYLPDYLSALSTAGVDGTLQSRFKASPLRGIVRGKTGTLNDYGVSALAGYVLYPQRTYAFAVLVNSSTGTQFGHWAVQEKIIEEAMAAVGVAGPVSLRGSGPPAQGSRSGAKAGSTPRVKPTVADTSRVPVPRDSGAISGPSAGVPSSERKDTLQ